MIAIKQLIGEHAQSLTVHDTTPQPRKLDWLWVVLFGVLAALELIFDGGPWMAAQGITVILIIGLLPWRRQFGLPIVIGVTGISLLVDIAAHFQGVEFDLLSAVDLPMAITVYAMFRWPTLQRIAVGSGVASATKLLSSLLNDEPIFGTIAGFIIWLALAALAMAMRYRASLIREQKAQVRLAERHDLARELHDTVAHHVSAIAVQAQAAQFVAASNPEAAAESMKNVEVLASRAIEEMRRMVGILRSDNGETRSVAVSNLSGFDDQSAELPVTVSTDIDLGSLPSPVAAALYRITQESITNARRHNRGITFIDVEATAKGDHIELLIINDGSPTTRNSGSGYGMIGMQERVAALEGTFLSGPRSVDGWRTMVTIPLQGSA